MEDLEKLRAKIDFLEKENKKLKEQNDFLLNNKNIAKANAEIIIIRAINKAYEIRTNLSNVLESLRGKTYEQGIKILNEYVINNKYYLGSQIEESKRNAKEFVEKIVSEIE